MQTVNAGMGTGGTPHTSGSSGGGGARRPRVGLALGSGAARGWAHVGVLDELQDMGIEPDIITGTSAGALVGGLYACGRLDELRDFGSGLTMLRMLRFFDISLGKGGLVSGRGFAAWYRKLSGAPLIEDMEKPFGAAACEIDSGAERWLTRGDLTEAVRASIAVPGVLEPVKNGNSWLVDGALVNPTPVSLTRALGADVVIAVDLYADWFRTPPQTLADAQMVPIGPAEDHEPRKTWSWFEDVSRALPDRMKNSAERFFSSLNNRRERRPQQIEVISNAIAIMGEQIARARAMTEPGDVTVTPLMRTVGAMQFHKAEDIAMLGRLAVRRQKAEILEAIRTTPAANRDRVSGLSA